MSQQFGGLESLIPPKSGPKNFSKNIEHRKEIVFSINIDRIKPNPYQPRREFDADELKALSDSIRAHGVLQPLLVSRIEGSEAGQEYQLIAGERRLRAARMANFSHVPVIIREEPSSQQKLELSLIENVQRADLNPMEKAEAFKRLQEEFSYSQKEIGRLSGKSREAVANSIRLLALPEEIKQALRDKKINEGHARAIMMAKELPQQQTVFAKVLQDGLNVREAEGLVQKMAVWKPQKKTVQILAEFRPLEEKIKNVLGIQTLKLKMEAGRPKLVIMFSSKKEIENLLKKLNL